MPQFCDVAVPVPLDATFTYRIPEDSPEPVVGGRVIVPFREQRLSGIVTELHDREPDFTVKRVSQVLDITPALTLELMELGRWIAQYYIAPSARCSAPCSRFGRVPPRHRLSHYR